MVYKVFMVQDFSDCFKFIMPLVSHLFTTRYTATMEPNRDMWDIFMYCQTQVKMVLKKSIQLGLNLKFSFVYIMKENFSLFLWV